MRVILIDDERLALEVLKISLLEIDGMEIVGMFTDPEQAREEMSQLKVDVVFLDMEMGSIHGLAFAEELMTIYPHVEVVFVTAYSEFAVEAFEVNAVDYLLKPVNVERLKKTIHKLDEKLKLYGKDSGDEFEELFIQAMGHFRLFDKYQTEVKWRTRKAKELFAYLWHHRGHAIHKARIIEDLWWDFDEERATT